MPRELKGRDVVSLTVATLCLLALPLLLWFGSAPVDKTIHVEMGRKLAAECRQLLGPGGKVTIIARDVEAFQQPAMTTLVSTLESEFGESIRSVEAIQVDPIRPCEVPPGDFYELLRRLPAGDV